MDSLDITGLQIMTRVGIYEWEQRIEQRLLVDLSILMDFQGCKDIQQTLDYAKLCQEVTHYLESKTFGLIETAANDLAEFIKSSFQLPQITVRISKPQAVKNAANIQVTINR